MPLYTHPKGTIPSNDPTPFQFYSALFCVWGVIFGVTVRLWGALFAYVLAPPFWGACFWVHGA